MHRYIDILRKTDLFGGICTENIGKILDYFNAEIHYFDKGEYIFEPDHEIDKIAVFIDGCASVINRDFIGNSTELYQLEKGGIFGEVHSLLPYDTRTVTVIALSPVAVLFIDVDCVLTLVPEISDCQSQLRSNLMRIMAKKQTHQKTQYV